MALGTTLTAQKKMPSNRKFQTTFFHPIGTNGIKSIDYTNDFSFNMLLGVNGGVNKMEIGGLVNYNKGDVNGFQLSGIANLNHGNSTGAFISGVCNILNKDSKGFQLAGVSNINCKNSEGVMISGVANISKQNATGFQLAVANINNGNFKGTQLGVFNLAKTLNGTQLGVLNIVDSIGKGTPIGLFSIVKNGYYAIEISTSEVINANLTYKMGVEHFYTIFTTGYTRYKNEDVLKYGLGLGSLFSLGKKNQIALEAESSQLVYNNDWNKLNLLNTIKTNYHFRLNQKLSLVAGPTFNAYITEKKTGNKYGTINVPYTIYNHESSKNKLFMWIGFNAGISLRL